MPQSPVSPTPVALARRDGENMVPHYWVQSVIRSSGLPLPKVQAACDEAGLDMALAEQTHAEIEHHKEVQLIEAMARASGKPFFGLEVGLAHDPRHGSILAYLTFNAQTLGEALEMLLHFVGLTRPRARLSLVEDGDRVAFRVDGTDQSLRLSSQYAEFVVASILNAWRTATGIPKLGLDVAFASPRRSGVQDMARRLGCKVRLGAEETEIGLPADALGLPMIAADHTLLHHLKSYGDMMLSQTQFPPQSVRDQVQHEILMQLARNGPSLAQTAKSLGVSERTLTRQLADDGESFRDMADDTRRVMAEAYLSDPALTIAEVAFLLGYGDPSSFATAFRRWTSTTPRQYRQRLKVPV